jgi:hypothetical protein
MGEKRALQETIVSNKPVIDNFKLDDHLLISRNIDGLPSFSVNSLIYVQGARFRYYKCKLGGTLEAASIVKNGGENA